MSAYFYMLHVLISSKKKKKKIDNHLRDRVYIFWSMQMFFSISKPKGIAN